MEWVAKGLGRGETIGSAEHRIVLGYDLEHSACPIRSRPDEADVDMWAEYSSRRRFGRPYSSNLSVRIKNRESNGVGVVDARVSARKLLILYTTIPGLRVGDKDGEVEAVSVQRAQSLQFL